MLSSGRKRHRPIKTGDDHWLFFAEMPRFRPWCIGDHSVGVESVKWMTDVSDPFTTIPHWPSLTSIGYDSYRWHWRTLKVFDQYYLSQTLAEFRKIYFKFLYHHIALKLFIHYYIIRNFKWSGFLIYFLNWKFQVKIKSVKWCVVNKLLRTLKWYIRNCRSSVCFLHNMCIRNAATDWEFRYETPFVSIYYLKIYIHFILIFYCLNALFLYLFFLLCEYLKMIIFNDSARWYR